MPGQKLYDFIFLLRFLVFLILHLFFFFKYFPSLSWPLLFLTTFPTALNLTNIWFHFHLPSSPTFPIVLQSHFDNFSAFICLMVPTVQLIIFKYLNDSTGGFQGALSKWWTNGRIDFLWGTFPLEKHGGLSVQTSIVNSSMQRN